MLWWVRHFLDRWEGNPDDDALPMLLRSAAVETAAARRMQAIFTERPGHHTGRGRPAEARRERAWSPRSSASSAALYGRQRQLRVNRGGDRDDAP